MPDKIKGEDKQGFISRCMSSDSMQKEFPKQDQRLAVCYSKWDDDSVAKSVRSIKLMIDEIKSIKTA